MISLIVAMDRNRLIGARNDLPWDIPEDRAHFKTLTAGGCVIMGRKTLESIVSRLGRPLPKRINIAVTRDKHYRMHAVVTANSLELAVGNARLFGGREIWIIGGMEIYREALEKRIPDRLCLTRIDRAYEGDAWFPPIPDAYRLVASEPGGEYWTYETWEKISPRA